MKEDLKSIPSPKVIIIDYFDSLINKIDIYTEEALEKLAIRVKEREQQQKQSERDGCIHQIRERHVLRMAARQHPHYKERCDRSRVGSVQDDFDFLNLMCPCRMECEAASLPSKASLPTPEIFNQSRMKVIEELRRLQEEVLEKYKSDTNKIMTDYNRLKEERPDYDSTELIKEAIFSEKFAFIIALDNYRSRNKFDAHMIMSDFYLSENDITYINKFMNASEKAQIWPTDVLDNNVMLITELCKTIEKRLNENRGASELLRIDKKDVLNMKFLNFQSAKVSRVEMVNLPSLRCFALCHNQITYMAPNAFDGMPQLESLFLFSNNLDLGPQHADIFKSVASIHKINLSFNHISYLHPNAFDNLFNLQDLNLSSNRLKFTDENCDIFANLVNLNALNIGYNTMCHVSARFFNNLINLKSLIIRGCDVKDIDEDAFHNLKLLKQLDLSSNLLETLPKNIFAGLACLEDINFLSNELADLDENVFGDLKSLHSLWLSTNKLKSVKAGWFKSLKMLKDIHIGNNLIETVEPNAFDDLKCLEKLDLSYNPRLKEFLNATGVFSKITNLKHLSLESVDLESIHEGLLLGLYNLETLLLARNKLSDLSEKCFRDLVRLKKLNLELNCFNKFDLEVLNYIPRVDNIILSKNPLENPQALRDHKFNQKYVFTIERQI